MNSEIQNIVGFAYASGHTGDMGANASQPVHCRAAVVAKGQKKRARRRMSQTKGRTEVYAFTPVEVDAIIAVLQDQPRDLALFLTGINTGLHPHKLRLLTWEYVTKNGEVTYRSRRLDEKNLTVEDLAIWDFGADTHEALRKWQKATKNKSGLLFPGRNDKALSFQQLDNLVKKWATLAGIARQPYGTHSLRKTHGQFLHAFGYDESVLRKMFKQSSLKFTSWYFRV